MELLKWKYLIVAIIVNLLAFAFFTFAYNYAESINHWTENAFLTFAWSTGITKFVMIILCGVKAKIIR